jgi:eukaryotic-like serine/threonine-protein kinase
LGAQLNSPQAFGPYELTERINIGGMAEVFRAIDRTHRRTVAIKRILPSIAEDDEFVQMFRDEAVIASQLDHPNIAKIYDVGKVDVSYYLALEFVNGKDLRTLFERAVKTRSALPVDFCIYVVVEASRGLDYAHQKKDARGNPLGLVHRDVSPQNVLVSFDGDVKLIDFGIAKAAGKLTRTQVGTIKGKFGYMSPEQVRGLPIDHRSDVFALGICLWEMLALDRLFAGDNEIAIMEKIRACEIPSLGERRSDVPQKLEAIILKALAKDVDERYASAADFCADLAAFAEDQAIVLGRASASEYMRRVFVGDPGLSAANEEKQPMAKNKGPSDLDVFEGLSHKEKPPSPADDAPTPFAPSAGPGGKGGGPPMVRQRTLLGMPSPFITSQPPPPPPRTGSSSVTGPHSGGLKPLPTASLPPPPPRKVSLAPPPLPPSQHHPLPPPGGAAAAASRPSAAGVPVAPPGPRGSGGAEVDMDWDDDEKTTVFERQGMDDLEALAQPKLPRGMSLPPPPPPSRGTLAGPAGLPGHGVAPPPFAVPGRASVPAPPGAPAASAPPSLGRMTPAAGSGRVRVPGAFPPQSPVPSQPARVSLPAPTVVPHDLGGTDLEALARPAPKRRSKSVFLVLLAGLAAAGYFAYPRSGKVLIVATGVGSKPLDKVTILVDGATLCESSPCTLDLPKGAHSIRASAEGYAPQEQGTAVRSGEETVVNFKLDRASAGTGMKVSGKQDGVELFVDGREIGPLPQEIKDLAPGTHKVVVKGSDRYAPDERTVSLVAEEIKDLGSVSLKVVRGLATFELRTPGAKVTLVSGNERRKLTDFAQPVEIETAKNWSVEATKVGYDDFRLPIKFDDRADKTFVIVLSAKTQAAAVAAPEPRPVAPGPRPAPAPEPPPIPGEAAPEEPAPRPGAGAAGGGTCTLNFNSIPVSNVVLDGRPLGGTPKIGVSASAGSHNVAFIHPELGKKATSVTCKGGETKPVVVRFSQ